MPSTWRTVRVFISSTFRDMHAERDHLVKVVFPALREQLQPYRVELTDIDLRWGVTREQAKSEQVVSLCLEQIDQCRPFFLCLLGQRYGWVPPRLPEDAVRKFDWLTQHGGVSVTEMEVLHAALKDARQKGRALFCFRDPKGLDAVPALTRASVFTDGDAALANKLDDLKRRIEASGLPVPPPYPCVWSDETWDRPTRSLGRLAGLEAFGRQVHDWLWEAVRAELQLPERPPDFAVDPLREEADFHERFLEARRRVYVGRETLQQRLHAFADGADEMPCVVTGPSGCGKSAALAQFVHTFRRQHPDALVLPHFAGASPHSTGLRDLLGRLCGELKEHFGFAAAVPETAAERATLFLGFLASVPVGRRVVLVLDALNQLDAADGAHELHWLPEAPPPHVKVVASCLTNAEAPHRVLAVFQGRNSCTLTVEPLTGAERRAIIREVPKLSAKTLDDRQVERLLANPATENPLFLLVALEELRVFGSFENLDDRIEGLPTEGDAVTALFDQVFERLEDEFDARLVKAVLTLLASARRGLSERELRELTANEPGAEELYALLRQLRPYLLHRSGLLDFYHTNVKTAVRRRYLEKKPVEGRQAHVRLAKFFTDRPLDGRQVEEVPWQWCEARAWPKLAEVLADLPIFEAAWRANQFEIRTYWARVEAESPLRMTDAYRRVLLEPGAHQQYLWEIAWLFDDSGHLEEALALRGYLVEHYRRTGDEDRLGSSLGNQALILQARGDLDGAMTLLRQQEEICRRLNNPDGLQRALGGQALVLQAQGDLDGAMTLHKQEEEICRRLNDPAGLQRSLGNQALILQTRGDLDGAMTLLRQMEEICRRLNAPAGLARSLINQASVLANDKNQPREAVPLADEAYRLAADHGLTALAQRIQPIRQQIHDAAQRLDAD